VLRKLHKYTYACKTHKYIYAFTKIPKTFFENNKEVYTLEISLSIGSTANYAGDGPTTTAQNVDLNGFTVTKIALRYYIVTKNHHILGIKFPNNSIKIGDEVISLNDMYCEHIRNVRKYIEMTHIHSIKLGSITTQQIYTESMHVQGGTENTGQQTLNTTNTTQTTTVPKRRRDEGKRFNINTLY